MNKLVIAVVLAAITTAARADCHADVKIEDKQFFDKVVVQSVAQSTWTGPAASELAFLVVTNRRVAFNGIGSVIQPVPMSPDELELYDEVMLSALAKSSYNTSGLGQHWASTSEEAQWAVGIAWDAMWARMTTRC
jgi:hypothetical protein